MKEFKLDLVACIDALDRCENADEDSDEGGEPAGAVLDELSRQLTATGAPPGDLETQLRTLLALTAELEAERAAHGLTTHELSIAASAFENERKAHAETRARLEMMTDERHRITDGYHKLKALHEDVCQQWRDATSHASPEAYRASMVEPSGFPSAATQAEQACFEAFRSLRKRPRVEPGADVVDTLVNVFTRALVLSPRNGDDAGAMRAVVVALAEMGASLMPGINELSAAYHSKAPPGSSFSTDGGLAIRDLLLSRLAPVLGARRALDAAVVTPTDEQLAEEALVRFEDMRVHGHGGLPLSPDERASGLSGKRGGVSNVITPFSYVAAYVDGARREGRR